MHLTMWNRHLMFDIPLCKLYTNSVLSMLNSRSNDDDKTGNFNVIPISTHLACRHLLEGNLDPNRLQINYNSPRSFKAWQPQYMFLGAPITYRLVLIPFHRYLRMFNLNCTWRLTGAKRYDYFNSSLMLPYLLWADWPCGVSCQALPNDA